MRNNIIHRGGFLPSGEKGKNLRRIIKSNSPALSIREGQIQFTVEYAVNNLNLVREFFLEALRQKNLRTVIRLQIFRTRRLACSARSTEFRPRQSRVTFGIVFPAGMRQSGGDTQKFVSACPVTRIQMIWIAPSERDSDNAALETRLWAAADQLRANSGLTSQQYSQPVLGLIFLRFAEVRFTARRGELEKVSPSTRRGSRIDDPNAYHSEGVLYLSPNSRFDYLLALPEGEAVGKALSDAMRDVEKNNPLGSR